MTQTLRKYAKKVDTSRNTLWSEVLFGKRNITIREKSDKKLYSRTDVSQKYCFLIYGCINILFTAY